jgi:hypothetical protein
MWRWKEQCNAAVYGLIISAATKVKERRMTRFRNNVEQLLRNLLYQGARNADHSNPATAGGSTAGNNRIACAKISHSSVYNDYSLTL